MKDQLDNKAALFIRVSTKEQADEGFSLDAQRRLVRDYTERKGFVKRKEIEIPESASGKQERKAFNELLTFLHDTDEVTNLICEKVDRVTRNFKDAIRINDWLDGDERRKIHFVKQSLVIHKNSPASDKFQWDIWLVMARQYSNNLSEEAKKGLYEKASQGFYPGNKKKGYVAVGPIGRKIWIIDDTSKDAIFIKRAFELYDQGTYTLRTLSKALGSEGWKTPNGKYYAIAEIHNLLTDCFYCGEFTFGKKHYPNGKHDPLISKELYYRVQDRLSRKTKAGKYTKHTFVFGGGLLTCGECGRAITAEMQKNHNYYHCTKYNTQCTQEGSVREELLEKLLTNILKGLQVNNERLCNWIAKAVKENHKESISYHMKVVNDLDAEYKKIQQRLDIAYDDRADGILTKEVYEQKKLKYEKQLEDILIAKDKHHNANIDYLNFGMNIFELSQKASYLYEKRATFSEKRELLNFVFSNLELKDGNLVPTYHNGFELVASRAKTGNWLFIGEEARTLYQK